MLIIDRFAYTNRFAEFNPYKKVLFSLILILLSVINSNVYLACVIIIIVIIITVLGAQIPAKSYAKMILAPIAYLSISILTIIFSFGFSEIVDLSKFVYIKTFSFMNFYIGIASGSIENGLIISFRAVSSIVSMYFLILTTPINQQIKVMKRVKLPNVFIELYVLTYRFIVIFFEEAVEIHTAQKMKFGYNNYKNSMNSLAILLKTLFARIMIRYRDMENILEIKHFDGNFYVD